MKIKINESDFETLTLSMYMTAHILHNYELLSLEGRIGSEWDCISEELELSDSEMDLALYSLVFAKLDNSRQLIRNLLNQQWQAIHNEVHQLMKRERRVNDVMDRR